MIKGIIGIDLTPKIAHLETGMKNALVRMLASIPEENSINIVLFCTGNNADMYKKLLSNTITISLITPIEYNQNVDHIDVLHSPFNDVHNKIKGVLTLLSKYDLIPLHFKDKFKETDILTTIQSCMDADYILTSSKYVKEDIVMNTSFSRNKINVIYLPVDKNHTEPKKISIKINVPYILYPAAGRPHKNHINLFKALSKVSISMDLVLTTGEIHGTERFEQLKDMAKKLGIDNNVHILGRVSENELSYLYSNASALIYPSLAEGFGYPLVEAMTYKLPILCSNWSCIPEVVGKVGIYFNPTDPIDIARKIEVFFKKPLEINNELYDKHLELYSSTSIGKQMNELYKKLIFQSKIRNLQAKRNFQIKRRLANKNILTELSRNNDFSKSYLSEFVVLVDCSRFFDGGHPFAGIPKYMQKILEMLSNHLSQRIIPFFDFNARGFKSSKSDKIKCISINKITYDVYPKDKAITLAKQLSSYVIYYSPFHPLPEKRDPSFSYSITVYDVFHLTHKDIYPNGHKSVTKDIVDSIDTDDEVIAISDHTANALINYLDIPLNITIAFLPSLNSKLILKNYQENRKQILIPFQKDSRKNFQLMLNTYKDYLDIEEQETILCIFGRINDIGSEYLELIEEIKKMGKVILVDSPSDAELSELIYKSFCFIYLSELEGFGLPPLEAMTGGCPPIIFNNTALKDVYKGWPFMLSNGECSVNIANKIKLLRSSDEKYITNEMNKIRLQYTEKEFLNSHLSAFYELLRRKYEL